MRPTTLALAAAAAIAVAIAGRGQGREPFLSSRSICLKAAAFALSKDFHARGVRRDRTAADFARANPLFCRNALVTGDGWPPPGFLDRLIDGPTYVYVDYGRWRDDAPPERSGLIVVVTRRGYVGSPD